MGDMIDRDAVLALFSDWLLYAPSGQQATDDIREAIAALPAVTVGVEPAPDAAAIRIADEVFDRLEAKGATAAAFGAAEVGEALREAGAQSDAAAIREAALREAADVVDAELMRWGFPSTDGCKRDQMRTAILALTTEKPHDRA